MESRVLFMSDRESLMLCSKDMLEFCSKKRRELPHLLSGENIKSPASTPC